MPVSFDVFSSKPLYFSVDGNLRYSENGTLDMSTPVIWDSFINKAFVSPDSRYIILISGKFLYILDNEGIIIDQLHPVSVVFNAPFRITYFRDEEIHWDSSAKGFYIIKDYCDWRNDCFFSEMGVLCYYDIKSKTLAEIIKPFPADHYFFSHRGKLIYFVTPTPKGDLQLNKFDVKTKQVTVVSENELTSLNNGGINHVFYNFTTSQFEGGIHTVSHNQRNVVIAIRSKNNFKGGLYLYKNGRFDHIIKTKDGYSDDFYNIILNKSYFLPGNRFFIVDVDAKEFIGKLVVDIEKKLYSKLPNDLETYFSITSKDIEMLSIRESGIREPLWLDNSDIEKVIFEFRIKDASD